MSIGIVTTWFERGAAYVSKLYMEALQEEHDVFIYARSGESYAIGDPNWDGEHVYWSKRIPSVFGGTLLVEKEFKKWVNTNNIDVILFNEQTWWPPLLWCKELGVKTIAYIDYYTEETVPLFAAYDALICNTKKHYAAFEWHPNATHIPWGTDINVFSPQFNLRCRDDLIVFFHSCGMSPKRKGTDLLIKSLDKIDRTGYRVVIHAQIQLEKLLPDLLDLIQKHKKSGQLEVIEETVPAPGLYHLGDVYVYPSRLEGIGLTVVEAISCGLGLIVPDCGPMNEFAGPYFSKTVKVKRYFSRSDGYYWPQNEVDIAELAKKMEEFIDSKSEVSLIRKGARDYAKMNLNWNKNSVAIQSVFNQRRTDLDSREEAEIKKKVLAFESRGGRKFNPLYLRYTWVYKIYCLLFKR